MKLLFFIFALLLIFLQYRLWSSHNGFIKTLHLEKAVAMQNKENKALQKRNMQLADEIYHLKSEQNAVESLARKKLGMVKKDEVFYRIIEEDKKQ